MLGEPDRRHIGLGLRTSLSLSSHPGGGLLGVLSGLLLGLGGLVLGGGLLHRGLLGLLGGADGLLPLGLPHLGERGSGRAGAM